MGIGGMMTTKGFHMGEGNNSDDDYEMYPMANIQ